MMTQQIGFSIISAPLAAIDRRALSQAWYSALHLEQGAPSASSPEICKKSPARPRATLSAASRTRSADFAPAAQLPLRTIRESVSPRAEGAVDRRAKRSPLARRIERKFLRPMNPERRATFSFGTDGARVHVTLQGSNSNLRLVAICPSRARVVVARAMEEARYALALRGVAFAPMIRESYSCK